jgi:tetratricopeptide (TPR) repeat protein
MNEVIERMRVLKERVHAATAVADRRKAKSSEKDYTESKAILGEAISLLVGELKSVEEGIGNDELSSTRAHELADCYGMLGGVCRREENFGEAVKWYDKGRDYEKNKSYDIQNSYNMTNSVAVRILQDAKSLEAQKGEIDETIKILEHQVHGPRRDQSWAWADLGLLYLLRNRTAEAAAAYENFRKNGARASYDSTISVLNDVQKSIAASNPPIADGIAQTVHSLMRLRPAR